MDNWLTKTKFNKLKKQPYTSKPALNLTEVIQKSHCFQIQIPGYPTPQNKIEIILTCINEKIVSAREENYWREERIEIDSSLNSLIKEHYPEVSLGKPIADKELKEILPFLQKNGYLEKISPEYSNGFDYRYSRLISNDNSSDNKYLNDFNEIIRIVNDYSDIYSDLICLDQKWKIRRFMSDVISNNWLPKQYWYQQ